MQRCIIALAFFCAAAAGAPAGDYAGVRARFSRTAGSGSLPGFCTMQESVTFSADFRVGK